METPTVFLFALGTSALGNATARRNLLRFDNRHRNVVDRGIQGDATHAVFASQRLFGRAAEAFGVVAEGNRPPERALLVGTQEYQRAVSGKGPGSDAAA